jgi:hypothetical protein
MILDNELVNHLIRQAKSRKTFSKALDLRHFLDEDGSVATGRGSMPLLDALDCLIKAGIDLHPDRIHPANLVGIEVSTAVVKDAIITLSRVEQIQGDLLDPPQKPFEKQVDSEIQDAIGAHRVAEKLLKKVALLEQRKGDGADARNAQIDMTMDAYVQIVNASPNPGFTKTLLSEAGPGGTQWFSPKGPMPALETVMVPALTASKSVEVEVKVLYVREKLGFAMLEIVGYKNEYSRSMLCHHNAEVELRFDPEQIERDDLILLQYRRDTVSLRAAALCATYPKASKKTVLTLSKLLVSRVEMNKQHAVVHQFDLLFED